MAGRQLTPLESALAELRAAVAQVSLPLPLPGAEEQRKVADEIIRQLDDYVMPRLNGLETLERGCAEAGLVRVPSED